MAHEIEEHDTMMSVRQTPWHRLGTVIPDYTTPEDAARLGGLDFTVKESPVEYGCVIRPVEAPHDRRHITAPDHKVLYREYYGSPEYPLRPLTLGVVGSKYQVVQPEAMTEFLEAIVEAADEPLKIETCGTLRNSKIGWFQAVMPDAIQIDDDPHVPYILIANSWDGATALRVLTGQTRVVCANTLAWAIRGAQTSFAIRHTSNAKGRIQEAREALKMVALASGQFQADVEELLRTPFTDQKFDGLAYDALRTKHLTSPRTDARFKNRLDQARAIWDDPNGPVANIKGTAYGAVMAISDYELWGTTRKDRAVSQAMSVLREKQPLLASARALATPSRAEW